MPWDAAKDLNWHKKRTCDQLPFLKPPSMILESIFTFKPQSDAFADANEIPYIRVENSKTKPIEMHKQNKYKCFKPFCCDVTLIWIQIHLEHTA